MQSVLPKSVCQVFAFIFAFYSIGCADNSQLLQGQDEIKKELAEIKKMVAERPVAPSARRMPQAKPFAPTDINVKGTSFLGKPDAPVTLVEFTDFRCPYCKRHATRTLPELVKAYVNTGKLKYVLKEFPLKNLHPDAEKLSLAALCAGDQNAYWKMHDLIFTEGESIDPNNLAKPIATLKLKKKQFKKCYDSEKYAGTVAASIALGSQLGVTGTPSFFLGKTDSANHDVVHATQQITGAQPVGNFSAAIDALLR